MPGQSKLLNDVSMSQLWGGNRLVRRERLEAKRDHFGGCYNGNSEMEQQSAQPGSGFLSVRKEKGRFYGHKYF